MILGNDNNAPKIGTHQCSHRCVPDDNEHVSIVYPGAPGRPSRATPEHLVGQSIIWDGVRAQIISANIALDAPVCEWDAGAPGYAVRWRQLGEEVELAP